MRQHKTSRGWQRDPTRNKNITYKDTWDAGLVPEHFKQSSKKEIPTRDNPFVRGEEK